MDKRGFLTTEFWLRLRSTQNLASSFCADAIDPRGGGGEFPGMKDWHTFTGEAVAAELQVTVAEGLGEWGRA